MKLQHIARNIGGLRNAGASHKQKILSLLIPAFIHFLSIGIYLHPLTSAPTPSESPDHKQRWKLIYSPHPQLDEIHIMSTENHDISPQPTTSWTDAWYNDYWGRPLTSESSHKSWRPLSIWSFRFGKGGDGGRWLIAIVGKAVGGFMEGILGLFGSGLRSDNAETYNKALAPGDGSLASELFVHRFINVLIHAAIVQIIGAVATLLFSSRKQNQSNLQLYTKYISQILFALHPVHVEAVANVANRPHILALLFNTTILDPNVPLVAVAILGSMGLLTAETAIFQFPAIVLTMTAIRYRELLVEENKNEDGTTDTSQTASKTTSQKSPIVKTFITLLPRYLLLILISTTYLLYRHYNNSLSIPNGLIRPAENPFYDKLEKDEWTLGRRAMNYSYILSLHIMKSFGIEIVGSSHEYGFDCIPEIQSFHDFRLLLPLALTFLFLGMIAWSWYGWNTISRGRSCSNQLRKEKGEQIQSILLILVFFSWMATLFPIAGILKVGTFVADRIAVASSFGTCIFFGRFLATFCISVGGKTGNASMPKKKRFLTLLRFAVIVYMCTFDLARRTHNRAAEWMDSAPLLESSLKTCPRSIKSNLEMSKLYSGLVHHMLDLERSLSLIRTAQSIDHAYCDVHQQFAHVYFQQSKYIPFEEEMVKSLMCPFTMGQAMNNWNKYWKVMLHGGKNKEASERYQRYMSRIQEVIARAEKEEGVEMRSGSHVVGVKDEL
ncbi:hypothetical protein ACHAXR_012051 [Thalassiosira sp. AJA248-18]